MPLCSWAGSPLPREGERPWWCCPVAHSASRRQEPMGELVEEQHKGGREPIWGWQDRGFTEHGLTTLVALGRRRPVVGGQTLG
jgi:hypothetical protein